MTGVCENPTRRELATAIVAGTFWALAELTLSALLSSAAAGASCRVHNYLANGSANVGSGTLINVTDDRRSGLVLSCAHLLSEGVGRVVVQFPDGRTHGALVVAVDRDADLSALEISNPREMPAPVSWTISAGEQLRACGFGPSGSYRCVTGLVAGQAEGPGQTSLRLAGAVRSGDSGGGVFDGGGRLVGVVWGASDGETYASTGAPLRRFLDRVLGRRAAVVDAQPRQTPAACPDGLCPLLRSPGVVSAAPAAGLSPAEKEDDGASGNCDCGDKWAAIETRLDAIEQGKQDRGQYVLRGELEPLASQSAVQALADVSQHRHQSLLDRIAGLGPSAGGVGRAAGVLAATALGVSGPAGWAVVAAASIGGWLVGRRLKKRLRVAGSELREKANSAEPATRDSQRATSTEATAAAEAAFRGAKLRVDRRQPIERDDREARELLRLSQLEGRDPLQDAVARRIALDRLDAAAEGDADPQHAQWADQLRRELRERFNEIAPTKFEVNAEG